MLFVLLAISGFALGQGFIYKGDGLTTNDPEQQIKDHVCLSLIMFLEARSDGDSSQMFHGMVTVNRALSKTRWKNTVCEVLLEPSQYEPIKDLERETIAKTIAGDLNAIDQYILSQFKSKKDLEVWHSVNDIAFSLITSKNTNGWLEADHFYAPKSLSRRGLKTPNWILSKDTVQVAGDTHFLKTKRGM